jgi:hypothetical protein
MTSVTQKIPNLIGGISQQPDELMPLGSVRDAVNVIPDVTDGLKKRSGSRLINPLLTNEEGSWFHFNYADNQKYIGKINYDGTVHMFNVADGLPVNIFYKDWEYTPDEDAASPYPNCSQSATSTAKAAWQAKVREYNVANGELNSVINQKETSITEERVVKYRVEPVTLGATSSDRGTRSYQAYRVYEGQVRKSGPDIYIPEEMDGFDRVRGNRMLSGVTVLLEEDDFERPYSNVDVYENIFTRLTETTTDFDAEIAAKKAEAQALRSEVDNLYATYIGEVAKCGYEPSPNITRDIIDSSVPPEYLKHELPQQIKTLVVGDTIFLTNPRVATSMEEESLSADRPTENYIELTTIAANKVYTLRLTDEKTKGTSYTVVKKVSVIDSKYETDASSCITDFNTETFNDGNKVNLGIRIDVRGEQRLQGDGTSLEDYVCKYKVTASVTNGGAYWQEGDVVEIECANRTHKVRVEEVERIYDPSAKAYIFPPATPSGTNDVIKADEILIDISTAIKAVDDGFQTKIIGDGLYVTHADADYVFSFETPEGQLMNIVTNQVNNIADLPRQCKGGYIVKIANTDSEYDDYWAEFVTEFNGIDGPGVWEETVAPGYPTVINAGSMPHMIKRTQGGNFIVSPIDWELRLVGDNVTNPTPSFISKDGNDLRFINKMAFFRNRLCMLSGDNVVCSRPGDYFNFFKGSALQLVDNDPIDIAVGSTSSSANAALLDAIEVAEGLLTFTENEQHVLSTDSEVFSPTTARFSRIGTYRFNGQVAKYIRRSDDTREGVVRGAHAFSLGNSVGFLSDAGLNSKLMEIYNIGRSSEASANELSKPVSRLVPFGINAIADSKDNNIIALANRGGKDVWVYRYFDNDQQRQQSAWFRWTTLGTMLYHCIMDDVYWYVSIGTSSSVGIPEEDRDIVSLQRIDLKDELATAFVEDKYVQSPIAGEEDLRQENGQPFQAHLDNYRIAQPSEFTYYNHLNQTYFRAPLVYYKEEADAGNLVAYMLSPTIFQRDSELYGPDESYFFVKIGSMIPITVEEDNLGTWFVMDGDWSNTRMMIGYQVEMKVELPTLYPTQSRSTLTNTITRTDTRSSLTLHRLKLNFGQTGVYESTIKVKGRDDYTELYECKTMDIYPANEIAFDQTKTQTVPVYANNKNTKITISSTHPSPATINSLEWEGDYSAMYYKRV